MRAMKHHAGAYSALLGTAVASALMCGTALAAYPPPVPGTTQGTFAAGNDSRLPAFDTRGRTTLLGQDGSTQARVNLTPGGTAPAEYPTLQAGPFQVGGALLFQSDTSTNVDGTIATQGTGKLTFGNGSGAWAQFLDPGAAISASFTYTPGVLTGTYPNTMIFQAVPGQGAVQAGWEFDTAGTGIGLGYRHKCIGAYAVCMGEYGQAYGAGSVVSGNFAYDYAGYGVRCHESAATTSSGPNGSNQVCEQTLQTHFTDALVTHRLVVDGGVGVTAGVAVPIQANGHGTFSMDVECTNIGTGAQALWLVKGSFERVGTLTLPYVTGTGASLITTGTLSAMTLAVTADTTDNNLSILPSPPSGNTASIACSTAARWMQRIA
jgi:hypothetical protein